MKSWRVGLILAAAALAMTALVWWVWVGEADLPSDGGFVVPTLPADGVATFRQESEAFFALSGRSFSYSPRNATETPPSFTLQPGERLQITRARETANLADPWGRAVVAYPLIYAKVNGSYSEEIGREWVSIENNTLVRTDEPRAYLLPAPYASISYEFYGRPAGMDATIFTGRTLVPGMSFNVTAPKNLRPSSYDPNESVNWQFQVVGYEQVGGKNALRVDLVDGVYSVRNREFPLSGTYWLSDDSPFFLKRVLRISPTGLAGEGDAIYSNLTLEHFSTRPPPPPARFTQGSDIRRPPVVEPYDGFAPPEGSWGPRFSLRDAVRIGQGLDFNFAVYLTNHPRAQVFHAKYTPETREDGSYRETWRLEFTNPDSSSLYNIEVYRQRSNIPTDPPIYGMPVSEEEFTPSSTPIYTLKESIEALTFGDAMRIHEALLPGAPVQDVTYVATLRGYTITEALPPGVGAGINPQLDLGVWGGFVMLYSGPVDRTNLTGL